MDNNHFTFIPLNNDHLPIDKPVSSDLYFFNEYTSYISGERMKHFKKFNIYIEEHGLVHEEKILVAG